MAQSDPQIDLANEFCRDILPAVSRTFALSIRLLPGELGAAVRCAYLLCRIADSIEDEPALAAIDKASLLDAFGDCFDDDDAVNVFVARAADLRGDPAYVRLVRGTNQVFVAYQSLPDRTRGSVRHWVREMIAGMQKFVLLYPHGIRIQTLNEYKEYCYYVAGTVGYLLTDLWYEYSSSIGAARYGILRERCRAFAEALQTVNILKDVVRDAEHENSVYIPQELLLKNGSSQELILAPDSVRQNCAAMATLTRLGWDDLDLATAYLLAIPRRAVSIRIFCALPLLFAYATLRDLTARPDGLAGRQIVKISRREVRSLTVLGMVSVVSNRAMSRLVRRARSKPVLFGW